MDGGKIIARPARGKLIHEPDSPRRRRRSNVFTGYRDNAPSYASRRRGAHEIAGTLSQHKELYT